MCIRDRTQLPSTVAGIKEDTWYVSGKCDAIAHVAVDMLSDISDPP